MYVYNIVIHVHLQYFHTTTAFFSLNSPFLWIWFPQWFVPCFLWWPFQHQHWSYSQSRKRGPGQSSEATNIMKTKSLKIHNLLSSNMILISFQENWCFLNSTQREIKENTIAFEQFSNRTNYFYCEFGKLKCSWILLKLCLNFSTELPVFSCYTCTKFKASPESGNDWIIYHLPNNTFILPYSFQI